MSDNYSGEPNGVLLVNKHEGVTSHDIVSRVRRLYNTKRVGHTGTLDPMATGVLVVLVGRAAKAAEYLSHDKKSYSARMRLGLTTDTEDITGNILTESVTLPNGDELMAILPEFRGEILQVPPMYSALKVGGRKLVDMARAGEIIEREARPITIYELSCTKTELLSDYVLDVTCSSGTYIRTLCADIGARLGCGAVMTALKRTECGGFSIDDCHTVDELEEMTVQARRELLIPIERLFSDLPCIKLPAFYEKLCRSGCEIYQKKIGTDRKVGERVRIADAGGHFFALGEVREYEEGSAVKAIKTFELV